MSRVINEINVHCSATRPNWMAHRTGPQRVAEIRRWHVEDNKWRNIGYHWLIDRDGLIYPGRPESQGGAFEPKVNATAIGVCLIGGHGSAATDDFHEHYTDEQDAALRWLIDDVKQRYPSVKRVTGHNDYSGKACPGFKVSRWLVHKPSIRAFSATGTAQGSGLALAGGGALATVELLPLIETINSATVELQSAVEQTQAVDESNPARWVLIALILVGAGFALWRRWLDYRAGKK